MVQNYEQCPLQFCSRSFLLRLWYAVRNRGYEQQICKNRNYTSMFRASNLKLSFRPKGEIPVKIAFHENNHNEKHLYGCGKSA